MARCIPLTGVANPPKSIKPDDGVPQLGVTPIAITLFEDQEELIEAVKLPVMVAPGET
jgi:hypothetical protein